MAARRVSWPRWPGRSRWSDGRDRASWSGRIRWFWPCRAARSSRPRWPGRDGRPRWPTWLDRVLQARPVRMVRPARLDQQAQQALRG